MYPVLYLVLYPVVVKDIHSFQGRQCAHHVQVREEGGRRVVARVVVAEEWSVDQLDFNGGL